VRRTATTIGFRKNTGRTSRNLAVPGEDMTSVFDTVDAEDVGKQLLTGGIDGRDILKFLILDLPLHANPVSQLTRVRSIRPTFIMVWLGNNDVLPMATRTNPAAATFTPTAFGTQYRRFLNALADTGADMAVANLPDVTEIAALRRADTDVTSCRTDGGDVVPVAPDDRVSLALDPSQLPVPPCGKVLDSAEGAQIRATVIAYNTEITAAIADVEQSRGVAIATVDVFTVFDDAAMHGVRLGSSATGGFLLDTRYLGGIFSLDGVHPTHTAHALIANAFIDAIHARFGDAIADVDVQTVASEDPLVENPFRPAGEPPFGLIDQSADVQDGLDDAFHHVESQARDVFKKLRHRVHRLFDRIARLFS